MPQVLFLQAPYNEQCRIIKVTISQTLSSTKEIELPCGVDFDDPMILEQAVNEQIMKEICAGSEGQGVMNKIFEGKNKNDGIKNKIDNISQVYYKCNKYDNFECSICFDEFKENELLKQLRCKHIFHKECLSQWLLNEKKCPICNKIC